MGSRYSGFSAGFFSVGFFSIALFITGFLLSCSSDFSSNPQPDPETPAPPPNPQWTWVSGSNSVNDPALFGEQGVSADTNHPGGRAYAVAWHGQGHSYWFFGGQSVGESGQVSSSNDLWRWDGSAWVWESGSNTNGPHYGIYGQQNVADANNQPGSRDSALSWIDSQGRFWLFGGYGYGAQGAVGNLNDLWFWDGNQWVWVSGSQFANQAGVYGNQGIAANANVPGARSYAVSWTFNDQLWLFGGQGYDRNGDYGELNDLWRWDSNQWTWMAGSNLIRSNGNYGIQGAGAASNSPPARYGAIAWRDRSNHLWLFGGRRLNDVATNVSFNDLWRWQNNQWTWVSGSNSVDQPGSYGVIREGAPGNVPGARAHGVAWVDSANRLWLFGGVGYGQTNFGNLNDLWYWSGSQWTWEAGSTLVSQPGVYGVQGEGDPANSPGARTQALAWTDRFDRLWLFGGQGFVNGGAYGYLNDLWRYDPVWQ